MKISTYKCSCGCDDFFFKDKGNQKGIYCNSCGKWLKWADKNERNLDKGSTPTVRMSSYEDTEIYLHSHDNACTVGELKQLLSNFDDNTLVTVDVPERGGLVDLQKEVGLLERRYGPWLVLTVPNDRQFSVSNDMYKVEDGKVKHVCYLD